MQYVWVILLFLPSALSQFKGKFVVVVPNAPVFSVSGSEVVLSCSVREQDHKNITVNTVDMNVTWFRSDLRDSLVHLYGNHKDLNTDQIPSYRGRTAVIKEQLKNGDVSLKLSNIRVSDEGEYTCRVESKFWEDSETVKLSVEVVGSEPVITVEKYESGKFSLLCESKGWYPEPELQWRNSKGVNLTAETETQPVADLFNVKSRITVEKIDLYFCTVTQRVHKKEGLIDAQTLHEFVPNPWKTVGIIIGVLLLMVILAGVVFYRRRQKEIMKEIKKREEIKEVTSLLKSYRDGLLQHHNLSQHQWNHVEFTLLNSEKDLKEFNLRKFDPSDRGVEKLKKVITSSKKAVLQGCDLTEKSCEYLASVLQLENSKLTELNLRKNTALRDSGVKKLCGGLKDKNCKLEILRLDFCSLTEESCADLASVLKSENSKLIELHLSDNTRLKDSGVENLCDGLKDKNCKLKILRLEDCGLSEKSCEYLDLVFKSENSKLTELNLRRNKRLKDLGVKNLCDGLKDKHCKLQILWLVNCFLTEKSCEYLASVLKSENSKLIELHLSNNELGDSGVKNLCDGLKDKNCKLQILWLEKCGFLTEKSCEYLASVLKSENSKLMELNLSEHIELKDSGVEKLCDGLKDKNCKLEILRLDFCDLTEKSCADLAKVLILENSKLIELNLSRNTGLRDSGVEKLCDGLKHENCKLKILRLESCSLLWKSCEYLASVFESKDSLIELHLSQNKLQDSLNKLCKSLKNELCKLQILRLENCYLTEYSCEDLASVLKSENSTLIELNLNNNTGLEDSGLYHLCDGLKDEHCKLQKLRLADCRITDEGVTALASFLNPSSPLKELDLRFNDIRVSEQILFSKLKDTFPDLNVKI